MLCSPMATLTQAQTGIYNGPYFDATDPEADAAADVGEDCADPVVDLLPVELRGDGILSTAQEDRRGRQRLVRQGVDQLM